MATMASKIFCETLLNRRSSKTNQQVDDLEMTYNLLDSRNLNSERKNFKKLVKKTLSFNRLRGGGGWCYCPDNPQQMPMVQQMCLPMQQPSPRPPCASPQCLPCTPPQCSPIFIYSPPPCCNAPTICLALPQEDVASKKDSSGVSQNLAPAQNRKILNTQIRPDSGKLQHDPIQRDRETVEDIIHQNKSRAQDLLNESANLLQHAMQNVNARLENLKDGLANVPNKDRTRLQKKVEDLECKNKICSRKLDEEKKKLSLLQERPASYMMGTAGRSKQLERIPLPPKTQQTPNSSMLYKSENYPFLPKISSPLKSPKQDIFSHLDSMGKLSPVPMYKHSGRQQKENKVLLDASQVRTPQSLDRGMICSRSPTQQTQNGEQQLSIKRPPPPPVTQETQNRVSSPERPRSPSVPQESQNRVSSPQRPPSPSVPQQPQNRVSSPQRSPSSVPQETQNRVSSPHPPLSPLPPQRAQNVSSHITPPQGLDQQFENGLYIPSFREEFPNFSISQPPLDWKISTPTENVPQDGLRSLSGDPLRSVSSIHNKLSASKIPESDFQSLEITEDENESLPPNVSRRTGAIQRFQNLTPLNLSNRAHNESVIMAAGGKLKDDAKRIMDAKRLELLNNYDWKKDHEEVDKLYKSVIDFHTLRRKQALHITV